MRGTTGPAVGRSAGMAAALLVLLLSATVGCIHHHHRGAARPVVAHGHGPPPHAPAHGYRHNHPHDGIQLVFDADLRLYVVGARPGYYWHDDRYLRWTAGTWQMSSRVDGAWVVVSSNRVPAKLRAKYAKKAEKARHKAKRKAARDSHPAKHGD